MLVSRGSTKAGLLDFSRDWNNSRARCQGPSFWVGIFDKSYNEFIRCFHQFVSLIFSFPWLLSVWTVEKENKLLISPNQFFSQCASWKINHNKYSYVYFIPYFCLLVCGILVTLVAWFSFCFFCLSHLALQNVNKDYIIFSYFYILIRNSRLVKPSD